MYHQGNVRHGVWLRNCKKHKDRVTYKNIFWSAYQARWINERRIWLIMLNPRCYFWDAFIDNLPLIQAKTTSKPPFPVLPHRSLWEWKQWITEKVTDPEFICECCFSPPPQASYPPLTLTPFTAFVRRRIICWRSVNLLLISFLWEKAVLWGSARVHQCCSVLIGKYVHVPMTRT